MKRILYALLCIGMGICAPILVKAQLVANFTGSPTSGCSPIVVQFTDLSTGGPTTWHWDLGNGTISTIQNPSTTYVNPGTYTVTLTVTNGGGSNTHTITNYITVLPSPTVDFVANDTSISCPPKTVTFTNLSVANGPGTMSYQWDFGDGGSSTATNPTHTYNTIGYYNVTLIVTNSNGCSKSLTKTQYIKIVSKPTSAFTYSILDACHLPVAVSFTNTSSNAVSYTWLFGDGGTSTLQNPTHNYASSGVFSVTLIATNAAGCSDTSVQGVYISPNTAHAVFTGPTSACAGNSVTFVNTSTPANGANDWSFGDGGTSNALNGVHTYASAGTYTVRLIYTYNGCTDTMLQTIVINAPVTVGFNAANRYNCSAPYTVNFNNTSTGATSYLWDFGDGNTSTLFNPSHTYNSMGQFTVTLTVTNGGCSATLSMPAYVIIQVPVATITAVPSLGCAPHTVSFTTTINPNIVPTNAVINFGDGNSVNATSGTHTYPSIGTYNVTFTYTLTPGCVYTATTTVTLGAPPVANFTAAPTTICPHTAVTFTNTSTNATSYLWIFGDGTTSTQANPVHAYGVTGVYTVKLVAINAYCSDTLTMTNYITVLLPHAVFSAALGSCGDRYTFVFTNSSQGADTDDWNFGDGNTSTSTNGTVTHTYAAYGNYTVTLIVHNNGTGCNDTTTNVVHVFPLAASFTANHVTVCKNNPTQFTAVSNTYYTNYAWTWGDGTSSNGSSNVANHTYTAAGTYTVKLVITDIYGCHDSLIRTNYIQVGGPVVAFTATPFEGCPGMSVSFVNNTNAGPGNTIVNYAWNFGDGATSTLASPPAHIYSSVGTYTITLSATDQIGCSASANYVITVTKPSAQFTASDTAICEHGTISFVNTSTGAISYAWDFGDGGTSTQVSPTHMYNTGGYYTVRLIVTSSLGCTDTMTRNNYIHVEAFHINFTLSDTFSSCPPLSVHVTSTTPVDIATYLWTFGNGSQSVGQLPSTLYTYPGVYPVKLIATNAIGCRDSITHTVTVLGPTGSLSYNSVSGCLPVTVTLTANTTNASTITWDMNNGYTQMTNTTPPVTTFTYTYTTPGVFVPLIVLSNGTCQVSLLGHDTIRVDGIYVDFSYAPTSLCQSGTVHFTDTSFSPISNITSVNWTFGDGGTANTHNPVHTYSAAGTYTVRLIMNNATGCADTVTKTVTVHPPPVLTVSGPQNICIGALTGVSISASGASTYLWSPGGTLSCTACATTTALPTVTTTYTVTGTDTFGCVGTNTVLVTVSPLPTVTITPNPAQICLGSSTTITASGVGLNNYAWSPATGLSATNIANPVASPTVTTTYTVTAGNGSCSNTATVTVTVNPLPTVNAGPDTAVCVNSSVQLQATGNAIGYTWTPATGLSCTNCANPVASPLVTTSYIVTGSNGNACNKSDTVVVTVRQPPLVDAGPNQVLCQNQIIPDTLQGTQGLSTYAWTPATGLSCTNCFNPTTLPTVTTLYTLTATDSHGCSNFDTVRVTLLPPPVVAASANPPAICLGASSNMTATGATTYTWTPATGLSCTNCANPVATPTATTTYTVTGSNGSCSNTNTVTVTVNPLPTINAGPDTAVCLGSSVQLQTTGNATGYSWTPATGLSCTNCANPVATPTVTTSYVVTGTNANACTQKDTIVVTVRQLPLVDAGPNQVLCQNQIIPDTLHGTQGLNTYAWTPASGLSCTNCFNPTTLPTVTTLYTLTATDIHGCGNSDTVRVTLLPPPVVAATANPPAICLGASSNMTATGATTYIWTPATGLSCTNCANPVATPTATTTYTVTGSNGSCSNTNTVTVTVNPLPTINAGPDTAVCLGSSVQLQTTGNATGYSWTPATGLSCTNCANPVATPTVTTSYVVTGTNANACTQKDTIVVTVRQLPIVDAGPNQSICQGQTIPDTLHGTQNLNTYAWTPATGLSCTNCFDPTTLPTVTTTYTLTATDIHGCANSDTVSVLVLPPPNVTTSPDTAICSGLSANLSAAGAASYTWTPATGLSCTNCANPVASPTATTTYSVTGTVGQCSSAAHLTVTVNPLPTVNAGPDTAVCNGSSVQLQVNGTATGYIWSPAGGLSCTNCNNPLANPAINTSYIVTGTDNNSCSKKDTVNVTVHALPTITAASQALCPGGSVTLNAMGAVSYTWAPGASLSCTNCASPVASPAATTTYTITGTDAFTCVNTGTVTVTINPLPSVTVTPNQSICKGSSTPLQANGALSYTWSPAAGLSCTNCAITVASPTVTTTYTIVGMNGSNCSDSNHVTVTVNQLPVISAGPDTAACSGSSVQLQAAGGNTYAWSPVAGLSCTNCANPIANPNITTTYIVTGTDTNSCSGHDTLLLTIHPLPSITAPNPSICFSDSVQLQATGGATYAWSPATGLSCTSCAAPYASPTVTTTYTVMGTSAFGCNDSAHTTVTVNPLPVVTATSNTPVICDGTNAQLNATGATSYTWSPIVGLSCTNCANPVTTPVQTITYVVTGTDAHGCKDTGVVTVNVATKPVVAAGPNQSICKGNLAQLQVSGADTYLWSPSAGLSCDTCAATTATPGTTTTYYIYGTAANGCKDTAQVTVSILPQPVISAGTDQTICNGATETLQATGGVNYIWSPATGLSCTNCADPVAAPVISTTYAVTGTDINGCTDSAKVNITVIQRVPTTAGPNDTLCVGQTAQLNASGGINYLWSPSGTLNNDRSPSPVAAPETTTTYTVLITENSCFTDTGMVVVTVNPLPTITLGPDETIIAGSSVQLKPSTTGTITAYAWSPADLLSCTDCAEPIATPTVSITYTVTVSTNAGCTASAHQKLDLGCDKSQVFIPNTFTPNNDGNNDHFYASGKGISIVKRFSVYDRWGELIFEADNIQINDPKAGWDGTFKGQKLKPDVYVYIINAICETGTPLEFKGDISLVR